jgi:hypothetical protein
VEGYIVCTWICRPGSAATLWEVDEESIYSIATLFNQNLANGLNKDDAVQQAKLSFLSKNDKEKLLSFYRPSMILIGTAELLQLAGFIKIYKFILIAGLVLLFSFLAFFIRQNFVALLNKVQ